MTIGLLSIGGAAVDLGLRLESPPVPGTSNLADATEGFGGVARNVAALVSRLGVPTGLLTAVGDDPSGAALLADLAASGIDASRAIVVPDERTARYVAVLDPAGELVIGVNAMGVLGRIDAATVAGTPLGGASWCFAECNLAAPALEALIGRRREGPRTSDEGPRTSDEGTAMRLAIDTISVPKAARLPRDLAGVDVLFTNVDSGNALVGRAEPRGREGGLALAARILERGAAAAVVTLGELGHVVRTADGAWWSAAVPAEVVDVTGAGDALIAATLAGLVRGLPLPDATREGALAAALTAEVPHAAPADLDSARLAAERHRLDPTPMEGPLP